MASKEEIQIILDAQLKNSQKTIEAVKKLEKNIKGADKSIKQAEKSTKFFSTTLGKLTGALGIAYLTNAFKNFGKSVIFTRGEMERQEIAFEVMLGSAEKAKTLLNELSDVAETSPFGIMGITDTARQLKSYGIETENLVETIKRLGDVATGVNVPISRIGLVYGQVRTKGRLMGDDLRQFSEAGVPLLDELAKAFGKSTLEITKMKEKGEVTFSMVEQALINMTSEGGQFYKMMDRGNDTVLGQFDEFGDVITRTMMALGKPFEGIIKNTTKKAITYFRNLKETIEENEDAIREWAENAIKNISEFLSNIKNFANFVIYIFSNKIVQAIGLTVLAIKSMNPALALLARAFNMITKHPFIFTLTLIAINFNKIREKALELIEPLKRVSRWFGDVINKGKEFMGMKVDKKIDPPKMTIRPELESRALESLGIPQQSQPVKQTLISEIKETTTKSTKEEKTGEDEKAKEKKLKNDLLAIDKEYNLKRKQEENRALEEQIDLNNQFIFDDERKIKAKENEAENIKNLGEIEVEREREKLDLLRQVKGEDNELVIEQQAEFENVKFEAQLESDQAVKEASDFKIKNQKKNDNKAIKQKQKSVWEDHKIENKNFKFASNMASQYVALTQSKNKELNRIGQAAAIAQIGMQTAQSVMTIFKNTLAFFGGTGPLAFGMATAATVPVALFGATQIAEIAKNSFAVGSPFIEQDQLANIHKGEIIIPKTFSDGLRDGDLMLGNAKSLDNQQMDEQRGGLTIVNNFEGANFYGVADSDEMVKQVSEAISENIADGIIQPFPTEQI